MSLTFRILCGTVLLMLVAPPPLRAQYLYMDSNGNGIHDAGDRMNKKGPTSVDLYFISDENRDGTTATCNNNDWPGYGEYPLPMKIISYSLAFRAVGGTVSWSGLTSVPSGFQFIYSAHSSDTEHHVFYALYPQEGSIATIGPGRLYLGRLDVDVTSGTPSLEFQPTITRPDGFSEVTGFGTPCLGLDYDNTYKLGSDFQDADGLAPHGTPQPAPGQSRVSITPNPLNPTGAFAFETTLPGRVSVRVFDLQGRLVRTLIEDSWMPSGRHQTTVDGRNDRGGELRSGVYFYELRSADGRAGGRIVVLR